MSETNLLARQVAVRVPQILQNYATRRTEGEQRLRLLRDDPNLEEAFEAFCDQRCALYTKTVGIPDRLIWKTVHTRAYPSIVEVRKALVGAQVKNHINDDLFDQCYVIKKRLHIDLIWTQVWEFGFSANGVELREVYRKAKDLGLELCPPEVAFLLRLQYLDQPPGEQLYVAMKPLISRKPGTEGDPVIFKVHNPGGGPWISGQHGRSDSFLVLSSDVLLFWRP